MDLEGSAITPSVPTAALAEHANIAPLTVIKRGGETWIEGLKITGEFRDEDDA